jgi:hypothetical protein
VLATDLFADTHGSRYIDSKDDTDVLLAHHFLVEDLCWRLHDVVDFFGFGDLLRLQHNGVFGVAEFASPNLLLLAFNLNFFVLTKYVESSIASLAEDGISSGQF